jgi:hypothetical protein
VATDLKMKTAKVTNDLERENPGYVDDKTRAFGNTRYHLFGRAYDDIAAIRRIAKIVAAGVDRAVVRALVAEEGLVLSAFGKKSAFILTGPS